MSLDADLLEQAGHLARRDPGRPKQASLRRAVSTAYYAMFHLLAREATAVLVSDPGLRALVPRAFDHSEMKSACQPFVGGTAPEAIRPLLPDPIPEDLRLVARTFASIQERRHAADYNPAAEFNRPDTLALIRGVEDAFAAWERVRGQPVAIVFLVSLLLGKRWNR